MLPRFIPLKKVFVYVTGLIEILAGVGLLIKPYRHTTSVLLIIFFILILPANVYAAINKIDYEKGNYSGNGLKYLWFRIPLQIFFIEWVWYFGIYAAGKSLSDHYEFPIHQIALISAKIFSDYG